MTHATTFPFPAQSRTEPEQPSHDETAPMMMAPRNQGRRIEDKGFTLLPGLKVYQAGLNTLWQTLVLLGFLSGGIWWVVTMQDRVAMLERYTKADYYLIKQLQQQVQTLELAQHITPPPSLYPDPVNIP